MHILKSDGRVYIGQSKNPITRWYGQGKGYKASPPFWEAIQEHGWDAFSHIILVDNLSEDEVNDVEKYFIRKYDSTNPKYGFNSTIGGTSHYEMTDETRKKMSKSQIGRKHSEETKRKIGAAHKGKIVSDETRAKQSKAHKGRRIVGEHRDKLYEASKPRMRPVVCLETGIVYDGIRDAERKTGISHQSIGYCLSGVQKQTHGLHWEYYEKVM